MPRRGGRASARAELQFRRWAGGAEGRVLIADPQAYNDGMCGIVGYIGERKAVPIILDGLRRLEYRGYDSAGLAVYGPDGTLEIRRASGKLRNLEEAVLLNPVDGSYGIGHTRWATHGRPTEENAHPHRDCKGDIVVVHNGIVENYVSLKHQLQAEGHIFRTETDTEVLAHLIEKHFDGNLEAAVRDTVHEITGVYALAVIARFDPNKIVAARCGPPVVVGLGDGEYFVASDVPAILSHTRDVFYLADGDIAVLTPEGVRLSDSEGRPIKRQVQRIMWDPILAEKGGYKHFMLKEIFEQPRAVRDTLLGRVGTGVRTHLPGRNGHTAAGVPRVRVGEDHRLRHELARGAGRQVHDGEAGADPGGGRLRQRVPLSRPDRFGQNADGGDFAIGRDRRYAGGAAGSKQKGSKTIAICNVIGSMVTREAAGTLLTHAGPEIGVASTKAFTSQLTALFVLAMYLGQVRGRLSDEQSKSLMQELLLVPGKLETILSRDSILEELARPLSHTTDFLFLGRGIHFPIALEGALKLKEISYIHAEGYPAGEMKHGPNALIDERLPVVVLAARDPSSEASQILYEKTLSNIQEVKARQGIVIAVVNEGDEEARRAAITWWRFRRRTSCCWPILEIVPLQLLAYHIAVRRGCDVDQPRNLAKSVTVE